MKNRLSVNILTALLVLFPILFSPSESYSQRRSNNKQEKEKRDSKEGKRELKMEDVLKWNRITESALSSDGKHIAIKLEPWKGSATVKLYNNKGTQLFHSDSSGTIAFDYYGKYLFFKKEKSKEEQDSKNGYNLGMLSLDDYNAEYFENVKSFHAPGKKGGMLFVLGKDSTLRIVAPGDEGWKLNGKVDKYSVSENENSLLTTQGGAVVKYEFPSFKTDTIWKGKGKIHSLSLNEDGSQAAFLAGDTLYLNVGDKQAYMIANGVSQSRKLKFSPDGTKLYFGFKIPLPEKDTTIEKDDFPQVHIWNWNEKTQFTQQVVDKERDKKASLLAVYHLDKGSYYTITNENVSDAILVDKGDSPLVVAVSDTDYQMESMWTGRSKYDVYLIDTYLERALFALKGIDGYPRISPSGKFLYWYSAPDSSWATFSMDTKEQKLVTLPDVLPVFDVENDVPDWPSSYRAAGWSKDDKEFFVYGQYDIFKVDPDGNEQPVNMTVNGNSSGITYRYLEADPNEEFVNFDGNALLMGFDNNTKGYGYYLLGVKGEQPKTLYNGNFMLGTPVKAANDNSWIFTKERFDQFPDIWYSSNEFSKNTKITEANGQQGDFIWGSAELVEWTSYDGVQLQGVVYKPENHDPLKRYPVIVNFYDKNSATLHSYRTPEAHRSTVDYHWYNSHGYVIFNPDVVYKDGYPGESAFNAVMPGISKLIEEGIADPERIGAQGHSWGGYQVAYLATRTNLFAAIESGAPVVNMYSAYGGIRWGTGLNRSFQYEHQQSRIGKTPWESPLRYMENSPIFTMDKVNTPILIMHNDQDGHVPWYQGVEFFVALKRLRKPVWLLNYTGEVHWPQKLKNKIDFQLRMKQFFDHYLKDAPAPQWMEPGISAIELETKTGY